jgi:SAM-dependent methyltransferase
MNDQMHKEFPKTVGRKEFWKQIKRTVHGKEVSEEDISDIIKQITNYIHPNKKDHLLDLGCGNGALASYFFGDINRYTGVDFSKYLLGVAKEFFNPKNVKYIEENIEVFVKRCDDPQIYTKILIYGTMSYLPREVLIETIIKIKKNFINCEYLFIGNIPNRLKANFFFDKRSAGEFDLDDNGSSIGIWWNPEELKKICNDIGYKTKLLYMPHRFYGSKYRFDILLKR